MRLLATVAMDAPGHLAATQALLESVGAGRAPGVVRFEHWESPALILGAGQAAADADVDRCRERGIVIARRLAGGGAVASSPDYLSFTIVVPKDDPLVRDDILATYRRLGTAVEAALRSLDIPARLLSVEEARTRPTPPLLRPFCYGGFSPHEVLVGERKLVGVAQVRRFGAVAYVAGLYRRLDPAEHVAGMAGDAATRARRADLLGERMIGLETAGSPGTFEQFPATLVAALAARCGMMPEREHLTDDERDRAMHLRSESYCRDAWTFRH